MDTKTNAALIQRTSGFLPAGSDRIYYETAGARTGEALVFCHGLGGNHTSWYQQVAEFARSNFVVTWDQRGFGRSTNRSGHVDPGNSWRDLARVLDELHLERAHLVGQSMGGWTSVGFAIQNPGRTLSLTLADTIAGVYTPEIPSADRWDFSIGSGNEG